MSFNKNKLFTSTIIICCLIAACFFAFNFASNHGWFSFNHESETSTVLDNRDYIIEGEGDKGAFKIDLELAQTDAQRSQGLMHRTDLEENAGMLFRFDDVRVVQMWMRNTPLSLDMVFIDEEGVVKHVARNTIPFSENIISSRVPVRYVLEINAGRGEELGIKRGQQMTHPWFLDKSAQ